MPDLARLSALVHGRVQGVYYRAFTARVAKSLGLTGHVRNIDRTGDVEVVAEGEKSALDSLLEQLKMGPPGARVEGMDINWSDYTGNHRSFDVRY
jgi:acylphosphatase